MDEFLRKVTIERRVLSAINSRYGRPSLNGLNGIAIDVWRNSDPHVRETAAVKLLELAKTLSLMAERSAERPGLGKEVSGPEVERAIASLTAQ